MSSNAREANSVRDNKGFIAKVGAVYSAVIAVVGDILQPLMDFTIYFVIVGGALLAIELVLVLLDKKADWATRLNESLAQMTDDKWAKPVLIATALSFCIFLTMFYLNDDTPDGFLAEHSKLVQDLQKDLGLINAKLDTIVKNTDEAAKNTAKTAEHTAQLMEESKKNTRMLQEIVAPEDARKQLAQIGVPYTGDGFNSKIEEGDTETLKLFYAAGFNPDVTIYGFKRPIYDAVMLETPNYVKVLEQAVDEGHFDANKPRPYDPMQISMGRYSIPSWFGFDQNNLPIIMFKLMGEIAQHRQKNMTVGDLIAQTKAAPEKELLELIPLYNIDMASGLEWRDLLADKIESVLNELEAARSKFPEPVAPPRTNDKAQMRRYTEYRKFVMDFVSLEPYLKWRTDAKVADAYKKIADFRKATEEMRRISASGVKAAPASSVPDEIKSPQAESMPEGTASGAEIVQVKASANAQPEYTPEAAEQESAKVKPSWKKKASKEANIWKNQ